MTLTLEEARHEANASRKAGLLYVRGYRARWAAEAAVEISAPGGARFTVDTKGRSCTCRGFREHGFCSHLMGYVKLLWEQSEEEIEREEAHV